MTNQAVVSSNSPHRRTALTPRAFPRCRIVLRRRAAEMRRLYPFAPKFLFAKSRRPPNSAATVDAVPVNARLFGSARAEIFQTAQGANPTLAFLSRSQKLNSPVRQSPAKNSLRSYAAPCELISSAARRSYP